MINPQDIVLSALPSVPFTERKRLPRCAAVYFALNAKDEVLYVGQSMSLLVRWRGHHRNHEIRRIEGVRIAWLVLDDPNLLAAVEAACIVFFDPLYNRARHIIAIKTGAIMPQSGQYTFRSVRMPPNLFRAIEVIATREHISVNALCNAIFAIAVDLAQTEEGRAQIHAACTDWRTRWEHAQPEGRRQRLGEGQ